MGGQLGAGRCPRSHKQAGSASEHRTSRLFHTTHTTMSDAEVKNDVAAEAPSAEELKAKKRSAEVAYLL